ncbi:ABC transporter ATP-binding protein uup [Anatilimnocola aggregata]|uniref:ATP-binding protein Uup n=1 Tax=Anatilimnocola aggregata TaxID=2528021 RepID=A0A517YAT9_9BACT|nr:ATP-binding cassette domain-containing protein [Anatilimnocola aggregata]QDU27334.1 ABC transporter ATP-binding protein uup [Anatilimnocola aggregata]
MPLVTVRDLRIGYRGPLLLDGVNCQIDAGQRIGLLGRNGAGKTTFIRILTGEVQPDAGEVLYAPGFKMSLLPQDVPPEISGRVHDVIASGVKETGEDHEPEWQVEQRLEQLVAEMQLPIEAEFRTLSTGMKRRVLLARALVSKPDLLLLDEPTNHLDVTSITWLEEFLARWNATLIFVTHDRMFLRKLATRILEVDRGRLFDWSCDYDTFLKRKEDALAAEEKQNALFDKKLAEEEVWIRTGVKARRTRNEGRVRALERMRRSRSERQEKTGKVELVIQEAQRSGALVADVKDVTFAYGDKPVVQDFSTMIMRGDKIGIIGPNGAGKTTLLRILLGQLQPQTGNVRLGTNLEIAYFDQLRHQLREDETVQQSVGDGNDTIRWEGGSRHVIGYLQDFLFTPERSRTLVKFLSGGERNRVLLAKLFTKPANVIVLDEPTNDLDAETLELLEERLVEFSGTVLLVSHDREFLNNVVGSTLVFEDGNVKEYVGGYDDWQRQRASRLEREAEKARAATSTSAGAKTSSSTPAAPKRKLSYKEQKELDGLPAKIEQLESKIAELHATLAQPEFYKQPADRIAAEQANLKSLEDQLTAAFARWETLEK